MNKNLRSGLILGGIVVGILVLAIAAQAAGWANGRYANMPYRYMMNQAAGGRGTWQGANMRGAMASLMSQWGTDGTFDLDDMPCLNGQAGRIGGAGAYGMMGQWSQ